MDNKRRFRFKLASHLGMTVQQLEETMTYSEFNEWQEYAALEPLMSDRLELMLAQVISSLSNVPAFETMISMSEEDKQDYRNQMLRNKMDKFFKGDEDGN